MFITLLGGAAAWPVSACAQPPQLMDRRHRDHLLQLLVREGENDSFDPHGVRDPGD
jgi:hypothetical protein